MGKNRVIIGGQWGDEGKGKIVDTFAPEASIILRYQGGANAGHTVQFGDKKFVLNLVPSGIFHTGKRVALGPEVVADLSSLYEDELLPLAKADVSLAHLFIDPQVNITTNAAYVLDHITNERKGIGSTMRGIGPTYAFKKLRTEITIDDVLSLDVNDLEEKLETQATVVGITSDKIKEVLNSYGAEELDMAKTEKQINRARRFMSVNNFRTEAQTLQDSANRISDSGMVTFRDVRPLIQDTIFVGGTILGEGAQGVLLDSVHGYKQFVTSSSVANGEVNPGFRVDFDEKIGVFKAYATRVGSGPFPTELSGMDADYLREKGNEYGATTGRPRRVGWHDLALDQYVIDVSGMTAAVITKIDVLDDFKDIYVRIPTGHPMHKKTLMTGPADYLEFPGWQQDTSKIECYEDFPDNGKRYLDFLEKTMGIPIIAVTNSPDREGILYRS